MKAVIQVVDGAKVEVNEQVVGQIGSGLLILLGIVDGDTEKESDMLIEKILKMRTFGDHDTGKSFELGIQDIGGGILVVSQFTLAAGFKKGRRPDFSQAMDPKIAKIMYNEFVEKLRVASNLQIETGQFGAFMKVSLLNDGPITYILDTNA